VSLRCFLIDFRHVPPHFFATTHFQSDFIAPQQMSVCGVMYHAPAPFPAPFLFHFPIEENPVSFRALFEFSVLHRPPPVFPVKPSMGPFPDPTLAVFFPLRCLQAMPSGCPFRFAVPSPSSRRRSPPLRSPFLRKTRRPALGCFFFVPRSPLRTYLIPVDFLFRPCLRAPQVDDKTMERTLIFPAPVPPNRLPGAFRFFSPLFQAELAERSL